MGNVQQFKIGDIVRLRAGDFGMNAKEGALATVIRSNYPWHGTKYELIDVMWHRFADPDNKQLDGGYQSEHFDIIGSAEPKIKLPKRRKNDFYPTPSVLTLALVKEMDWVNKFLSFYEPCNGRGDISRILEEVLNSTYVRTADINPNMPGRASYHDVLDARNQWPIAPLAKKPLYTDWVVTNPPFNCAYEILENIINNRENINRGFAFLLRLSFLEPTGQRADFLTKLPPTKLIILPRVSFTADGKTDSVTCAWMVWEWDKIDTKEQTIKIYSKEMLKELQTEWKVRRHGKNYGKG